MIRTSTALIFGALLTITSACSDEEKVPEADGGVDQGSLPDQAGITPDKAGPTPDKGKREQGAQDQGTQEQGTQEQGTQDQGIQEQGTQEQGTQEQGIQEQGIQEQGTQEQGTQDQGAQDQGGPAANSGASCVPGQNVCPHPDDDCIALSGGTQGKGMCLIQCSTTWDDCPVGVSATQRAICFLDVSTVTYCAYVCLYDGNTYECPTGSVCQTLDAYTSICVQN